ncbi:MAG: hypothetical protein M3122_08840 [Actinomycetota bacterium]|nr:hypothetical protein [Actinomycetota bacterium]
MELLLTLSLVIAGLLLLLLSLAGVVFGVFMALDPRNREAGVFFAIWWVPGVAAALGILMRDSVTFTIGVTCFVVAGVALTVERSGAKRDSKSKRTASARAKKRPVQERAKRQLQDTIEKYRKALS